LSSPKGNPCPKSTNPLLTAARNHGILARMVSDLYPDPGSQTVELTGLPEPVVEDIKRLVQTLREKKPAPAGPTPAAGRSWVGL
jgi:hypothetical protein